MDHLTSGDVMTVMYAVVGITLSVWAMLIGMALLFGRRAARAKQSFEETPWRALGIGVLVALFIGGGALLLLAAPNPLGKVAGWVLLSYLLAISAVGSGGLALLVADRIGRMEAGTTRFSALARAAALIVVTGLVPLFGQFAYVPVVILISLGAGIQALFSRQRGSVTNGKPAEAIQ